MKPEYIKPITFVDLLRTRVLYPLSISGVHLCKHLIQQGEKLIFSLHTKCYVRFICRLMSPRPGEVMLKTPETVKKKETMCKSFSTTKQQTRCGPPRNQFVMICLLIVASILGSFSACFLNLIQ